MRVHESKSKRKRLGWRLMIDGYVFIWMVGRPAGRSVERLVDVKDEKVFVWRQLIDEGR